MRFKRLWAMFMARNYEFFRDRAAFGWNFLFPFLLIAGFYVLFSNEDRDAFKVGLYPCDRNDHKVVSQCAPDFLKPLRHMQYIGFSDLDLGLDKLKHHKLDLLLDLRNQPYQYWINDTSPQGYIVEKIMVGSFATDTIDILTRQQFEGSQPVRYMDWLFPGILGMNMMFSALYGVGLIVVRYRKNGTLKRFKATPLKAFEYLSAQMFSRIFVVMFSLNIVLFGCNLIFDFQIQGSYWDLLVMFLWGCLSLTALGLVIASRGSSEEFTNGILNFITWPMMFLSEVWFSIEGAPDWVRSFTQLLPLTHLLTGVRKIMNDGAALVDVRWELMVLSAMTILFLTIGASLFSWHK